MKATITAKQELEYKIPGLPTAIPTTIGHSVPLEQLSEDTIEKIFEQYKQNALEFVRSKNEPTDVKKK